MEGIFGVFVFLKEWYYLHNVLDTANLADHLQRGLG